MDNENILNITRDLFKTVNLEVSEETIIRYSKVLSSISTPKECISNITKGVFPSTYTGMVIEKDIPIYSYCEHHILPWFGIVHIGYLADNYVLGISKFTRIVNYFSSGITIQEEVTSKIADFLINNISENVIVMIQALHTCKVARGVENPFSKSVTIDARGLMREPGPKSEFLSVINNT